MLPEGIQAKEINIVSFQHDKAKEVADAVNDWLSTHKLNEIYDITFQRSNDCSAFIVYKQKAPAPKSGRSISVKSF
ncbi:hypothetical protein ACFLWS_00820 [Chloroflexota bacterium]